MKYEVAGWIGTTLIVLAYALVSYEVVKATEVAYQAMNVVGAIFLGISLFRKAAWPAFALQVVWTVIGLVALAKMSI